MKGVIFILKNKVILITGCSRGIGRAMLNRFSQEHAVIYANARKEGCLDVPIKELSEQYNTQIIPLYYDITDKDACKKAVMQIKKQSGHLDVLINNAGIMQDALLEMVEDKIMRDIFEVNVYAVIYMTQMAARLMKKQQSGSIINISSIVGVRGNAGQTVYSASKGAVIALTKTWAKELARDKIRVNAIAPGKIDTDMFRSIGEERVKASIPEIGFERLGTPEDVADTALFFASDLSRYVTGQILNVDGSLII